MKLKIGFIGSGNVATHLSHAMNTIGHDIVQIISKNVDNAKGLAQAFSCDYTDDIKLMDQTVDVCIICVSDNQIEPIAKQLPPSDCVVVHTCGSVGLNALSSIGPNTGVFYPLQSFSKERQLDVQGIPFLLEASNPETLIILHTLAKSLSHYVLTADSETRLKYHLSAVLANNFVNHLYTESARLLEDSGLDFNVLKPIIKETALKIQNLPPAEAQTGPAKRGDQPTIEKHLALIKADKELSKLYIQLTEAIANRNS